MVISKIYNYFATSYFSKTNTLHHFYLQQVGVVIGKGNKPTLYNVPITFGSKNQAIIEVNQDEWYYQNGNEKQDLKFEDCVPWKDKTGMVSDCPRICLPINVQYVFEEIDNRPKCQNGSDHICMMKIFMNMVTTIGTSIIFL